MERRTFVTVASTVAAASLAGCAGSGDADDPEDEPAEGEWEAVEEWGTTAVALVERGQTTLQEWLDDPGTTSMDALQTLQDDAEEHVDAYEEQVEPLEDDIEAWDFEREDGDERWHVDGELLLYTLVDLKAAVGNVGNTTGMVLDADGDPDELEFVELELVESTAEASEDTDRLLADARRFLTGRDPADTSSEE